MVHPAARSLGSTRLFRVSFSDSDGKFVLQKTSGCDGLTAPKPSLFGYGNLNTSVASAQEEDERHRFGVPAFHFLELIKDGGKNESDRLPPYQQA
jgi:hypothetical protein